MRTFRFAVHANLFQQEIAAGLGHRMLRDIRRGTKQGRFPRGDLALLGHAIGGAVWSVLRARLSGALGADSGEELAAYVLRMLGIAAAEARKIAARPLPPTPLATHSAQEVDR